VGKRLDSTCEDFSGELYAESLDSLYNFFKECRGIMRKFPVGKLKESRQEHLGAPINRILNDVFRPFWKNGADNSAHGGQQPRTTQTRLTKFRTNFRM
jgi:hypothetical protein